MTSKEEDAAKMNHICRSVLLRRRKKKATPRSTGFYVLVTHGLERSVDLGPDLACTETTFWVMVMLTRVCRQGHDASF
jgi:hypothetical protein